MSNIREFESTNESYFILDGVSYPKVYEAMIDSSYSKTKIKLVSTSRDTLPLVFSTEYTNIRVDGDSFANAQEAISRLNQVVFSKGGGSGGGGTTVKKTSELTNDGEDGQHPFITAEDIGLPAANPGDVLVKDAENWEASPRLTNVEAATDMLMDELDAEITERVLGDGVLQEQIDNKLNKPTIVSDFGTYTLVNALDDGGNSAMVSIDEYLTGHFVPDAEHIEESIRTFTGATAYTQYPQGIINDVTGLIVSTTLASRRWSGYINVSDYSHVRLVDPGNIRTDAQIAYYDINHVPILPVSKNVVLGTDYQLPANCVYIAHNVYADVLLLNLTNYNVIGISYAKNYSRNVEFYTFINEVKEKLFSIDSFIPQITDKYDLTWRSFLFKNIIDVNADFRTGTQQERLQQALDFAEGKYMTLFLGNDTINNTPVWAISSSLLIGDNTALLIGDGVKIKFSQNYIVDNIIRNRGVKTINGAALHSDDYMRGQLSVTQNKNIIIIGLGNKNALDNSEIEGSDIAYNAARPNGSTGGVNENWVGDNYGWRTISILLSNVHNAEVGGIKLTKPKGWGIVMEHCDNFYLHDIYVDSTGVKNGDGIDTTAGCRKGLMFNIQGKTYDDLVCIGNIPRHIYLTYPNYDRYIYPMYSGLNDYGSQPLSNQDCFDIDAIDIKGSSQTITVRVIATMGVKTYNISLNNIMSIDLGYRPVAILSIETGYNINGGSPAQIGDMYEINVNNVIGLSSNNRTVVKTPLRNSWLNNIQKKNDTIGVSFETYTQDSSVKVTNIQ